jgi:hypothetical protein
VLRRTALLATLIVTALTWSAPNANAWLSTGACAVRVQFTFNARVKSSAVALTHPSFSVSLSSLLGESCAITLSGLDPIHSTNASASGTSTIWTCESVFAGGSNWNQSFGPTVAPVDNALFTVTGSWGDWNIVLLDTGPPTYVGEVHLTLDPFQALTLAACETGGITSLSMVGVLVFQDP